MGPADDLVTSNSDACRVVKRASNRKDLIGKDKSVLFQNRWAKEQWKSIPNILGVSQPIGNIRWELGLWLIQERKGIENTPEPSP